MTSATIRYGDIEVPLHRRPWKAGPRTPYRKTYALKPGQHWLDAGETPKQWEHYVLLDDGSQVPVGGLIAREFIADGAESAYFVELWHGVVFVDHDLMCVEPPSKAVEFLATMKAALGGLRGLPDVMAFFPDGRLCLQEAKNVGSKDKIQPSQHRFANVARSIFGDRVSFGVTEWGLVTEQR